MRLATLLLAPLLFISGQTHAQTLLGCSLKQGEMLTNCEISASICNTAFEINGESKTIKQIEGIYTSSSIQHTVWKETSIYFQQKMTHDATPTEAGGETLLRSELNRLTGELHVRADWVFRGQPRYRNEVWQCAARKPLF